jgi:subtilisin family serine protease
MAERVSIPVEAAPQDAHDQTKPVALDDVADWSRGANREKVGTGVVVGVVDTKFQPLGWFSGGNVKGDHESNVPGLLATNFNAGHATFIAGLVLQQAPAARVRIKGVLNRAGTAEIDEVHDAAVDLVKGGVDVLNLSLGTYGAAGVEGKQFGDLLAELRGLNSDLVVVAAAGNKRPGESRTFYPAGLADHDRLVSVAAGTDESAATIATWSNSGNSVTFVVNGSRIVSTFLRYDRTPPKGPGHWVQWAGTSFATASASGLIAATIAPGNGTQISARAAVAQLRGGGGPQVRLVAKTFKPPFPAP